MARGRFQALLFAYLQPLWLQVALLLGLLLTNVGLRLLNPIILAAVVDTVVAGGEWQRLLQLAIGFVIVSIAIQIVIVVEAYLAAYVGLTATNALRADLAEHCLRLDMAFHNQRTPGELIERIDGDVGRLNNLFARFTVDIAGNGLLLIGVMVMLARIDWRVGLAMGTFTLLALLILVGVRNLAVPAFRALQEARAALFGLLEERLAGTEEIRANGATEYVLLRFFERSRALLWRRVRTALLGGGIYHAGNFVFTVGGVVALALGVYFYQGGLITLGTVFVIVRYTEMLGQPLQELSRQMQDLQQAGAAVLRIFELLDAQPTILDKNVLDQNVEGGCDPGMGALDVRFEHVHFQYADALPVNNASPAHETSLVDEDGGAEDVTEKEASTAVVVRPVIDDLSFYLPAGAKLGLLGRTGSGKTSLTRLLLRLFEPEGGSIAVGGMELASIRLETLRRRVTMVTQEVQLFHASVRDNLSLFREGVTDARMVEVLEEIGLGDWFRSLPDGLESVLAPAGSNLSAGQAQLLAFARVLLFDPGLVILDEASSRLDPATEQALTRVMERLLAQRTAIIIAHHLVTVMRADYIMILEAGRCVEFGLRTELQQDPDSRFSLLLRTGLEEVTV